MYDFYHDLGVGVRMHSGFPGETAGLLKLAQMAKIEQATMSFGYEPAIEPVAISACLYCLDPMTANCCRSALKNKRLP